LLRTASRAGFIDLLFAGTVCLWQLGIKARRFYLIPASVLIGAVLLAVAGGALTERLSAASSDNPSQQQETAIASYAERRLLMGKALDAITQYPLLGVGAENFVVYSGLWLEVHAAYLQIAVEGGIPVLILYLLFFYRGFANLWRVQRTQPEDDALLFRGALLASLIGFVIGAAFSPEAYHFFPYLTVCYTSVLLAIGSEKRVATPALSNPRWRRFDRRSSGLARQRLRPVG
jgi:O-antigen ligase